MFSLMGNCCSSIRNKKPKRPLTLAVLGLDSAGKSTTTKAFIGESVDPAEQAPTIGFNNHEFTFQNYDITFYDLGGGRKIRDIWKDYLAEIYGVVYVIDSAAPERFAEVKESLENLLSHEKVKGKPLLVLANKEDLTTHVDEVEIMERVDLERLVNTNKCYCKMQLCSAIKGSGKKMDPALHNGMVWLCSLMDQLYEKMNERVSADKVAMEEIRAREKEERRERVRKQREERQRREEEERKKLGIDKVEEEEDDDIATGNDPFRRLDSDEIKRKEENYKKTKAKDKERQKKLKEMEEIEDVRDIVPDKNMNVNKTTSKPNNDSDDDNDGIRAPRSSRSLLGLSWFNTGVANGHSPGRDGPNSDRDVYVQRSARQVLPPLEGSPRPVGVSGGGRDKKRHKKLKNRIGANDIAENEEDDDCPVGNGLSSSVSRIQVEAVHDDEDSPPESVVSSSSRHNLFRKSRGQYLQESDTTPMPSKTQPKKKERKKKQLSPFNDTEEDFDTLRLSQHFDDTDILRSITEMKPPVSNGHAIEESERSETPVKKLKKKKKHLRKNKLAPSDDEYELSDAQNTPKKKAIPWVSRPGPVNEHSDEENQHTNWGMAEDLTAEEITAVRRSRPNFDDNDDHFL